MLLSSPNMQRSSCTVDLSAAQTMRNIINASAYRIPVQLIHNNSEKIPLGQKRKNMNARVHSITLEVSFFTLMAFSSTAFNKCPP